MRPDSDSRTSPVPNSPILNSSAVAVFEASFARCRAEGDFVDAFYERLLEASPAVREKFAGTEMGRQRAMLEQSLDLVARAALGQANGLDHLERVAQRHSRAGVDIPPNLYGLWLDTLILVAREFDPSFDDVLEKIWRKLLGAAIERMTAAHGNPAPADK